MVAGYLLPVDGYNQKPETSNKPQALSESQK
jgi:hypothetical protein